MNAAAPWVRRPVSVPGSPSRYGLRFRLPPDDPMRAEHLLGPDWSAVRWYPSREERNRAAQAYRREQPYARVGDIPSLLVEIIDAE
jgi:hypothetical protein